MKCMALVFSSLLGTLLLAWALPAVAQDDSGHHPPITPANVNQLVELSSWMGDQFYSSDMVYSPDGTRLATISAEPVLRVWDVESGEQVYEQDSNCFSITWSPDGNMLACGGVGRIEILDAATGELRFALEGHTDVILEVAFSPDGTVLASSGGVDKTIRLWDLIAGQFLRVVEGMSGAKWSPDGQRLASKNADGKTVWLDAATGETRQVLDWIGESPAWSPDWSRVAFKVPDSDTIQICDTASGELLTTIEGFPKTYAFLEFSPDGALLVAGGPSGLGNVWIWDTTTGLLLRTLETSSQIISTLLFSPDGAILMIGEPGAVVWWGVQTKDTTATITPSTLSQVTELRQLGHHAGTGIVSVAWSPDGTKLVTGGFDMTARVWNAATGEQILALVGNTEAVKDVAWSSDGTIIVTRSWDNMVREWDAATGVQITEQLEPATSPETSTLSPNGMIVATWDQRNTVVWLNDSLTGLTLRTLDCHGSPYDPLPVMDAAWSPDGTMLAVSAFETILLWGLPPDTPSSFVGAAPITTSNAAQVTAFGYLGRTRPGTWGVLVAGRDTIGVWQRGRAHLVVGCCAWTADQYARWV